MKRSIILILGILLYSMIGMFNSFADSFNCFTLIAGKNATVSGNVLIAHNEDDGGEQVVFFYKIPGKRHSEEDKITFHSGATIQQPDTTFEYIWLQMPNMSFSDSYINENGVVIVSDACPSREDKEDYTNGGIGYELRKLIAERALNARHGVHLIGELVEKFGYHSSGRSYCIADKNEGWIVAVVQGRHWCAQRIKDDEVCAIPNYYTIGKINLQDTTHFLAHKNIIQYAKDRGWFSGPDSSFSFRDVYGADWSINHENNKLRHWAALRYLTSKKYSPGEFTPFSIMPEEKISLDIFKAILRDHRENSDLSLSENPHSEDFSTICANSTQYSLIVEIDNKTEKKELLTTTWISFIHPCTQIFFPIIYGLSDFPDSFSKWNKEQAYINHFSQDKSVYEQNTSIYYWNFFLTALITEKLSYKDYLNIQNIRNSKEKELTEKYHLWKKKNENTKEKETLSKEIDKYQKEIFNDVLEYNQLLMEQYK